MKTSSLSVFSRIAPVARKLSIVVFAAVLASCNQSSASQLIPVQVGAFDQKFNEITSRTPSLSDIRAHTHGLQCIVGCLSVQVR
jgi:hypothetical protein